MMTAGVAIHEVVYDGSGWKFTSKHKKTRRPPVVILASSDEERDIINGYKFGANGDLSKPAEFNDFTEALKQLGLYWLKLNRPPVAMG